MLLYIPNSVHDAQHVDLRLSGNKSPPFPKARPKVQSFRGQARHRVGRIKFRPKCNVFELVLLLVPVPVPLFHSPVSLLSTDTTL